MRAEVFNVANTTTAIGRPGTSFIDLVISMVSYAHESGAYYHVSLLDARINDIVNDIISSDFLSLDSQSTYACVIRVKSLVLKQSTAIPFLKEISKAGGGTRNFGVTDEDNMTN